MSEENNTSITKPEGEEFTLDGDFAAIAAALSLPIEDVEFSLVESAEGRTLTGKAKS